MDIQLVGFKLTWKPFCQSWIKRDPRHCWATGVPQDKINSVLCETRKFVNITSVSVLSVHEHGCMWIKQRPVTQFLSVVTWKYNILRKRCYIFGSWQTRLHLEKSTGWINSCIIHIKQCTYCKYYVKNVMHFLLSQYFCVALIFLSLGCPSCLHAHTFL